MILSDNDKNRGGETRIKVHSDDYNIVCEVLHNNDSLHSCMLYTIGGCRYTEKRGLFFSNNAPHISLPGTAYANIGGSRTLLSDVT